jgi:hypothetical protein
MSAHQYFHHPCFKKNGLSSTKSADSQLLLSVSRSSSTYSNLVKSYDKNLLTPDYHIYQSIAILDML